MQTFMKYLEEVSAQTHTLLDRTQSIDGWLPVTTLDEKLVTHTRTHTPIGKCTHTHGLQDRYTHETLHSSRTHTQKVRANVGGKTAHTHTPISSNTPECTPTMISLRSYWAAQANVYSSVGAFKEHDGDKAILGHAAHLLHFLQQRLSTAAAAFPHLNFAAYRYAAGEKTKNAHMKKTRNTDTENHRHIKSGSTTRDSSPRQKNKGLPSTSGMSNVTSDDDVEGFTNEEGTHTGTHKHTHAHTQTAPICELRPEHHVSAPILKWIHPGAISVGVAGTFTDPPWEKHIILNWCPVSGCFWVALHASVPGICGLHQFKYIVDGVWMCDPSVPMCKDGEHTNNVVMVFAATLQRMTSQRRLKNKQTYASAPVLKIPETSRKLSYWDPEGVQTSRSSPSLRDRKEFTESPTHTQEYPHTQTPNADDTHRKDTHNNNGGGLRRCAAQNDILYLANGVFVGGSQADPKCWYVDSMNECTESGSYLPPQLCSSSHINRCHSAYASAIEEALINQQLRRVASMGVDVWPPEVTQYLHSPEILLELNFPDVRERKNLTLQCSAAMMPHPDKRDTGGADAFFISCDNRVIGVADGVGEWDSFGLNPRTFAEELMKGCCYEAEKLIHTQEHIHKNMSADEKAKTILSRGYAHTKSYGSSTTIVACLDERGERISVANLGDSALIALRREKVYTMTCIHRTTEQQHRFNCPYQLSRLPEPDAYDQLLAEGKDSLVKVLNSKMLPTDTPDIAEVTSFEVHEGDLLIMGTDGVFDNLYDAEICAVSNLALSPYEALLLHDECLATSAEAVASALAEAATFRSRDTRAKSPFMRHARQAGLSYMGGKLDDITVVACWVTRNPHTTKFSHKLL